MQWKSDPLLYPSYLRAKIRRGHGIGKGASYKPWLRVRDVPSQGTSLITSGIFTNRQHHFLSRLEAIYFFLTERRASVIDIQEQWPILDIDKTLELCAANGIKHTYRGSYPEPFTIDFLITERNGAELKVRAASIKTPEDANDPEVRSRLAIEMEWCLGKGIPWVLIDTTNFNDTILQNLRFIRSWVKEEHLFESKAAVQFAAKFRNLYAPNTLLTNLIGATAKSLRMQEEKALGYFQYCAWHDSISVSLQQKISLNRPLVLNSCYE